MQADSHLGKLTTSHHRVLITQIENKKMPEMVLVV